MPQNKSTSRIAATTGKLAVALAALLAPAILIAETTNVTFDAALTNETGWVYNADIKNNNTGYYIGGHSAQITSAQFDFAITSVVIRIKTTASCTRNLIISPYDGESTSTNLSQSFSEIPKGCESDVAASWVPAEKVRRIAIQSTIGSQYLYFLSAEISGVPLVAPPADAQATDISGTRFALSWTNPENAVSNRITVSRISLLPESGEMLDFYDFNAFTNTNKDPAPCYNVSTLRMHNYPAFYGTNIYVTPWSTGVVQVSTGKQQGFLTYDFTQASASLNDTNTVSMFFSAKKHQTDTSSVWNGVSVFQINNENVTNHIADIDLSFDYPDTPFTIMMESPIDIKEIILKPSDMTPSGRRFLIDTIAFIRDYVPAHAETNLVKTAFKSDSTTYSVRDLSPRTQYIARITAFDAEGNESSPSEPLAVTTNGDAIPFSIRIQ